ncbi:NADH-cytochrome b5 reductase-like protein isoform X1 [Selaginella moellendorffii]|uniref:NADH-cytochrome b5 reductase-like protein isoform X1 n=1 Tax=Selaginella moellendorffii TaxID=88036 RepID=UPI000D1CEAF4|nr:NADH-cytochrome b5 reductase-like protein isoform X1 [Selaginella moellendorffii]|eukprot:XP_024538192.1 NADH-cytochrome b5 reductase-like protein isoform X1 [Selaginella moellendorffii]
MPTLMSRICFESKFSGFMALALRSRSALRKAAPAFSFHSGAETAGSGADRRTGAAAAATGAAILAAVATIYSTWKSETARSDAGDFALDPNEWRKFRLLEAKPVTHNTRRYRFALDDDAQLGLNVASCLLTKAAMGTKKDGKPNVIIRPYTPISDPDVRGHFDLLVKTYPEGKMSKYFAALRPGDTLEMKGPIPKLPYSANMKERIGMIAGGTGITPMFQVLNEILKNPEDKTQVSLIYANLTPDDILLKNELDKLSEKHPNFKVLFEDYQTSTLVLPRKTDACLQVFYVVDKPTRYWGGGSGFITKDILVKGLPPPSDGNLIMVCGPPGLMNHISGDKAPDKLQGELTGLLKSMGYTEDQVYKF